MSVLHTVRKRSDDVTATFRAMLDCLAEDETTDLYSLLRRGNTS